MFEARVCGIPCQIEVTYFYGGSPGRTSGPVELCYPEEAPEIEYELFDRRGYRAKWLEAKACTSRSAEDEIYTACLEHMRELADDY